jgi:CRISPR system Cascade subunit CasE
MNGETHWLSRVTSRPDINYRQLVGLGALDPYGQHQVLWKLFEVAQEERTERAEFLFRTEKKDGLPVFYVLSKRQPRDSMGLWNIESKPYQPEIKVSNRLAFKLRVNPVVTREGEGGSRSKRHDVVMDAKHQMNWKSLPEGQRPTLSYLAQKAGETWLRARAERLGCRFDDATLRADGYRNWRKHRAKSMELSMLDLEGCLTVADPERFTDALCKGVGPAKGFGCGLLLVRRV